MGGLGSESGGKTAALDNLRIGEDLAEELKRLEGGSFCRGD